MHLKHPDLALAVVIALANVAWALLPGRFPIIGAALAVPLVFVLPGYTLTALLFHRRSLDTVYRLLLSLGVSVSIDIIGGLLLNTLPGGLRPVTWLALLAFLTLGCAALAAFLQRGGGTQKKHARRVRFSWQACTLCGLAALLMALAVLFSTSSVAQQPHAGFTQFWMLPSRQAGQSCAVRVGIQSEELATLAYRIDITANGAQLNMWPSLVLIPHQKWERVASMNGSQGGSIYIEAQLYRVDTPRVIYREVHTTLYVTAGRGCQQSP